MTCNCNAIIKHLPLLPPNFEKEELTVSQAIIKRRSHRAFDKSKEICDQGISNILFISAGITDNQKSLRAAPTARNAQEIQLYLITKNAVYGYNHDDHSLCLIQEGDFRKDSGTQAFVEDASINLVYVLDKSKIEKFKANPHELIFYPATDAAFMAANTTLYATARGLKSVIRGLFDKAKLASVLKLNDNQEALLTVSIGF